MPQSVSLEATGSITTYHITLSKMTGPLTALVAALAYVGLLVEHVRAGCITSLNCSLNGVCSSGACVCDAPWRGPDCSQLGYKTTPVTGKSICAWGH